MPHCWDWCVLLFTLPCCLISLEYSFCILIMSYFLLLLLPSVSCRWLLYLHFLLYFEKFLLLFVCTPSTQAVLLKRFRCTRSSLTCLPTRPCVQLVGKQMWIIFRSLRLELLDCLGLLFILKSISLTPLFKPLFAPVFPSVWILGPFTTLFVSLCLHNI